MSARDWIGVAAALPDDDTLVLIALVDGEVWPAFRDYGRWCYSSGMPVAPVQATHWMHLPAAPGAAA